MILIILQNNSFLLAQHKKVRLKQINYKSSKSKLDASHTMLKFSLKVQINFSKVYLPSVFSRP